MTQMLLAVAVLAWIGNTVLWAAEPLVASGGFVRNPSGNVPAELRVLTYNLHSPPNNRMDDLVEALTNDKVLKQATILGLQEVNRHHRKTGYRDVASELATTLGLYYAFAVENPYKKGGGQRRLAILSRFPISQVETIALPHAGPGAEPSLHAAAENPVFACLAGFFRPLNAILLTCYLLQFSTGRSHFILHGGLGQEL